MSTYSETSIRRKGSKATNSIQSRLASRHERHVHAENGVQYVPVHISEPGSQWRGD